MKNSKAQRKDLKFMEFVKLTLCNLELNFRKAVICKKSSTSMLSTY